MSSFIMPLKGQNAHRGTFLDCQGPCGWNFKKEMLHLDPSGPVGHTSAPAATCYEHITFAWPSAGYPRAPPMRTHGSQSTLTPAAIRLGVEARNSLGTTEMGLILHVTSHRCSRNVPQEGLHLPLGMADSTTHPCTDGSNSPAFPLASSCCLRSLWRSTSPTRAFAWILHWGKPG
jgi:hypothetical protein